MSQRVQVGREVVLGAYEIVRLLGEGGMGKVFLGRDLRRGGAVVVKRMREDLAADPRAREDFLREMEVMRRFRHPGAVALLAAGTVGDTPCIVMEYVEGVSLEKLVANQGCLTPAHVGRLLGQLGPVLQAAHDQGILHRDLSSDNLMVIDAGSPGETLKVMDFGLARATGFYLSLERLQGNDASFGGGTPDYVCPEQLRGEAVDHRGDLYSAGIVLYRLLTGHLPFESAQEIHEILEAQRHRPPPSFASCGTFDVPSAIEAVVRRCLHKYPHERYGSARELTEAYQAALGEQLVAPEAFASAPPAVSARPAALDVVGVLDRFEAWMPEPIAVIKLRGFVEGVGGQVVASQPGVIKFGLRDPSDAPPAPPARKGLWGWLAPAAPIVEPEPVFIELHLEKKQSGGRSLVDITVAHAANERRASKPFTERICRELRAYLMIGR